MLIIFISLILPIKLGIKLNVALNEGYMSANIFLYRILILDLKLFLYNERIYYKIASQKPKMIVIDPSKLISSGKKMKVLFIQKLSINYRLGGNIHLTMLNVCLPILSKLFFQNLIKKYKVKIRGISNYLSNSFDIEINVGAFTNLLILVIGSIINLIIKLTNKEKKNAI